ncbi:hypothetical protein [Pedobacter ginsengisoli]|nr:hypothetical protein [Pedobacter ginsengisoli]
MLISFQPERFLGETGRAYRNRNDKGPGITRAFVVSIAIIDDVNYF